MNIQEFLNRGLRYLFSKKTKEKVGLEEEERRLHELGRQLSHLQELKESDSLLSDVEFRIDHA